jgi:hypothetical protein
MKALHHKVNIVPIIAKADTLTLNEVKSLKQRVIKRTNDVIDYTINCELSVPSVGSSAFRQKRRLYYRLYYKM